MGFGFSHLHFPKFADPGGSTPPENGQSRYTTTPDVIKVTENVLELLEEVPGDTKQTTVVPVGFCLDLRFFRSFRRL